MSPSRQVPKAGTGGSVASTLPGLLPPPSRPAPVAPTRERVTIAASEGGGPAEAPSVSPRRQRVTSLRVGSARHSVASSGAESVASAVITPTPTPQSTGGQASSARSAGTPQAAASERTNGSKGGGAGGGAGATSRGGSRLQFQRLLGRGATGKVYVANLSRPGQADELVAVKQLVSRNSSASGLAKMLRVEVHRARLLCCLLRGACLYLGGGSPSDTHCTVTQASMLSRLAHPHVIKYKGLHYSRSKR